MKTQNGILLKMRSVIAAGAMGGITQYPGTGKSIVCGISPLTGAPVDSNVGGYFGPYLKFSGWDAIEIQGIAEKDVMYLLMGMKEWFRSLKHLKKQ